MKYFSGILKQFTPTQRLIVLILLLVFSSLSLGLSQYFRTDDCRPIIEENIQMHSDFAKISAMLRKQRIDEGLKEERLIDSVMLPGAERSPASTPTMDPTMEEILNIANSHSK